jgi:hypothetical protein
MGIAGKMLKMLFIANENRGQGIGRQLLQEVKSTDKVISIHPYI